MAESVKDVYNQIASAWYSYRHHSIFINELNYLAKRWQNGRLLNLGCAHGPDFLPFKNSFELYGVDFSEEMLSLARKYSIKFDFNVDLSLSDVRHIPHPENHFDWVISIATYHHIEGEQERLKALNELRRVLKSEGEAFITVWNRWQPYFWFKPKELFVPWRKDNKTLYRYYYLFTYQELENLAIKAGFKVLASHAESLYRFPFKYFSRNICLLLRKE